MATIDQMFDELKVSFKQIVQAYNREIEMLRTENARFRKHVGRLIVEKAQLMRKLNEQK